MSFSQILQSAIELADNGYPMYRRLHDTLCAYLPRYLELYPTTVGCLLPRREGAGGRRGL